MEARNKCAQDQLSSQAKKCHHTPTRACDKSTRQMRKAMQALNEATFLPTRCPQSINVLGCSAVTKVIATVVILTNSVVGGNLTEANREATSLEQVHLKQAGDADWALITCNAHWREYSERSTKPTSVLSSAISLQEGYKGHSILTLLEADPPAVYGTLHRMPQ